MEREQQERFAEAVERKKAEAKERSEQPPDIPDAGGSPAQDEIQSPKIETGRPQDTHDIRAKSSRKRRVTADKWNQ